ncbi:hypothetical protein LNV08_15600 [Paucibacter sp. TC2R-5]|nr:hypothetical protein [Paucibacter sp. TC2R-5]
MLPVNLVETEGTEQEAVMPAQCGQCGHWLGEATCEPLVDAESLETVEWDDMMRRNGRAVLGALYHGRVRIAGSSWTFGLEKLRWLDKAALLPGKSELKSAQPRAGTTLGRHLAPKTTLPQPRQISASEVAFSEHQLLSQRKVWREQRLIQPDMATPQTAADLLGMSVKALNAWMENDRVLVLSVSKRVRRLPLWQFQREIHDCMPELIFEFKGDAWAVLDFLETPNGALNNVSPRVAIEQGRFNWAFAEAIGSAAP